MTILLFRTILIEFFILGFIFYKQWPRAAFSIVAVNLITHPLGSRLLLIYHYPLWHIEIGVIVAEAVLYKYKLKIPWWLAFGGSIIANLVTWFY